MAQQLDGKVAVITGAASGIGLATVECFVEAGARVLAADLQVEAGEALERRFPGVVKFQRCDVMQTAQIRDAIDSAAAHFGGLDILFSNAGEAPGQRLAGFDLQVGGQHPGAGFDKTLHRGQADARCRAGDDGHFAVEQRCHLRPRSVVEDDDVAGDAAGLHRRETFVDVF